MVPSAKIFSRELLLSLMAVSLLVGSSAGFLPVQQQNHPCIIIPSPIDSLAKASRPSHCASKTALFRQRRDNKNDVGKFFLSQFLPFQESNRQAKVVEAALVLANKQRREQWTKEASKQFSWIPPSVLSACVDGLVSAISSVAPRDLKNALKPGGLDKVRSKIETKVVRNLKDQPMVRSLPLPRDEKQKLLEYLVDLSLDFFLKDLQETLAAPSEKLSALDRERKEILQYMSVREIVWYKLRHKPMATIMRGLLSVWSLGLTVWFVQQNWSSILKIVTGFLSSHLLLSGLTVACVDFIPGSENWDPFDSIESIHDDDHDDSTDPILFRSEFGDELGLFGMRFFL